MSGKYRQLFVRWIVVLIQTPLQIFNQFWKLNLLFCRDSRRDGSPLQPPPIGWGSVPHGLLTPHYSQSRMVLSPLIPLCGLFLLRTSAIQASLLHSVWRRFSFLIFLWTPPLYSSLLTPFPPLHPTKIRKSPDIKRKGGNISSSLPSPTELLRTKFI